MIEFHEIAKLISGIINVDYSTISNDTLLTEIGMDSVNFVNLIVLIEEQYNIEILDSDLLLKNFLTIDKAIDTLSKYFIDNHHLYKCVVVDCDNVLWKGIAGEGGEDRALVDYETNEFSALLHDLKEHGIYICLCSKNNYDSIISMLHRTTLKELDFAIIKTNSTDKSNDVMEIANELGISTNNMVFIDDSDYELGLVSSRIPNIKSIKFDYNNSGMINLISSQFILDTSYSIDRTKLFHEQKNRIKALNHTTSIDEYNRSLNTSLTCRVASAQDIDRLFDISQRTNRFNLSGKHYTKNELNNLLMDDICYVYVLSAKDMYGDMGIVGMAVIKDRTIENFMLSCRVIGREFEDVFINYIKNECNQKLYGIYNETELNKECKRFYLSHDITLK